MNKKNLIFGFTTVFITGMSFSIIMPIIPFLVHPYVSNANQQAIVVTLLFSIYALCLFLAAPGLGFLSDYFGRKPLLLICIAGTAIGYFILGIGGSLVILFIGRIIDGITGGNIGIIYAFFLILQLTKIELNILDI